MEYFKNLKKMEFVITYACTGKCKHCSEGDHAPCGERIDPVIAAQTVMTVAKSYPLQTVMTFGGEPLLYPDAVLAIQKAAYDMGIPKRQVITNGYFSKNPEKIREIARSLADCGVNDLLLSSDAFHQETIPLETVEYFAKEAKSCGIPIRIQPAYLVSRDDKNPYNLKTNDILLHFHRLGIEENEGNLIFPEGNARIYLAEYFKAAPPENPYIEDPRDIRCLSFEPNGNILNGNIYRRDILQIMKNYSC